MQIFSSEEKNRKLREHMLLSAYRVLRDLYFYVDVMNLAWRVYVRKVKKG